MATELKPCPFCGSTDVSKVTTVFTTRIMCRDCGANILLGLVKGHLDSLAEAEETFGKEAIEAWNRRAKSTPCDFCKFSPPSSFDGKPCTMCVAEGRAEDD